ncbi:MAG TPA: ABC transporter permease subunit [Gaiellaceae bacterium]
MSPSAPEPTRPPITTTARTMMIPWLTPSMMLSRASGIFTFNSTCMREVAPEAVEAAHAFGATRRQILAKVKIPLAGDAIMLGVNQGIIMVLAVVVIAGLVGSGALGYEVAQGLVRNQFGQGVIASLAILALGIALDRTTQGNRRARREQ